MSVLSFDRRLRALEKSTREDWQKDVELMSDEELEEIIARGGAREAAWLKSLSDHELENLIKVTKQE